VYNIPKYLGLSYSPVGLSQVLEVLVGELRAASQGVCAAILKQFINTK